jgi:hypothetical protein
MRTIVLITSLVVCLSCKTREEKIKEANEKGKFLVEEKTSYAKGVGEALSKDGKEAAEKVSEGVGEVFKGLNKGFDKSFVKAEVRPVADVEKFLKLGRAGRSENDSTGMTNIAMYIIFVADCDRQFILKAFDDEDVELGRVKQLIKGSADDTGYASFAFDERTPLDLADYYTLELVP